MLGYPETLCVEVSTLLQRKRRHSMSISGSSVPGMSAQKFAECVVEEGKGSGFPTLLMGGAIGIIFLESLG